MPQFESHFFSSLIFWEVVSFLILLFVLYKFAFPGILSVLEEREKKIKDSLDQAERHRSEAESRLKEYEAKLNAAAKEAEGILMAAKERAQRLMDENEQRMTVEAERIKGDAKREIDQERRKAIQDIRVQTTELALMVAEKVVQRSLNEADHRKFADEALEALSKSYQRLYVDRAGQLRLTPPGLYPSTSTQTKRNPTLRRRALI
jgi:F-type H+-transporting ATPase subunit b